MHTVHCSDHRGDEGGVPAGGVYLPKGCTSLGGYLPGGSTCLGVYLLGVYLPGGVPAQGNVPAQGRCTCWGVYPSMYQAGGVCPSASWDTHPHLWTEFLTHTCENITFPQLHLQMVKIRDLTRDWTQIACLAARQFNHYTRMFSMLVWGCNWILFMHGWFCRICLIHLIGRKYLHFEKKTRYTIKKL